MKTQMKTQLIASLALVAASAFGVANAADLGARAPVYKAPPAPIAQTWNGLYVGVNGGGGWGNSEHDFSIGTSTGSYNTSGGLVGGTLGANWQTGQFVLGVETDLDWADIKGSALCPNPAFTCSTSDSWLGTTRARLGWAPGSVLFYGTGGVAYGDIKAAINAFPGASSTQVGWAAGAGVEWKFAPQWSVKAEYLYVDLGSMSCNAPNCSFASNDSVKFNANIVRAGLNFKFY